MTEGSVMTEARFIELIGCYGAELSRWPAEERVRAGALMRNAPHRLRDVWERERMFDALLAVDMAEEPSIDLERRILASAPTANAPRVRRRWFAEIAPAKWMAGGALAASLGLGFFVGYAGTPGTARSAGEYAQMLSLNSFGKTVSKASRFCNTDLNFMALPEELLALLQYDDLEFISRTIAEGYLSGHHPSVRKGVGTDFNQYKVYQQGDEAAKIDWKLFARSDKYFVREAERESERSIHFILDSSASMNFISQSQGALSKFNYGKYLIGALAYLAQKQGDPFSLTLINNNGLDITATGSGRAHWYRVLNALQQHNSTGAFPGTHWQSHLSGLVSKACMVVFISDCYQSGTEISDCLSLLKHQKNDVLTACKHFPGHGSAAGDTHAGFVDVTDTWESDELEPYNYMIQKDLCPVIMTSHIFNGNFDTEYPATLSKKTIQYLLRDKLGFDGVVISDDMQMRAISDHYGMKESLKLGLEAGIDVFCYGNNLLKEQIDLADAISTIEELVENGDISEERIDNSVNRILLLKKMISF